MRKLFYLNLMERTERNGVMHWIDRHVSARGGDGCCTYLPYADQKGLGKTLWQMRRKIFCRYYDVQCIINLCS